MVKKKVSDIHSKKIALEGYTPKNTREFCSNENYITWGKKHEIPRHLIQLLDDSIIHKNIVMSLAQQITGYGFTSKNENGIEDSTTKTFLDTPANQSGETWNDILEKASLDYILSGMIAFELHWNLNRDKLVEIYNLDFSSIASGKADENDKINFWFHSTDWTKSHPQTTPIKSFDPNDRTESKQIYVFKKKFFGKDYYPQPDYYSNNFCKWVGIDNQLAEYKFNGLNNGFSAGYIISFNNGQPPEDKKEEIINDIMSNLTGGINNKTVVVSFADSKEYAVEIIPIPSNEYDYGNLMDEKQYEILQAHRICDGILVCVPPKTGTGFSSNSDQIKTSYELLFKNVIEPKQKILESQFSLLAKYFGYDIKLKIEKILPFDIQSQDQQKNNPVANA